MPTETGKETDQRLREMTLRQLEWEPEIVSTEVNVAAHDGVVTLTGFVHSYSEKFAAERAARSVYGVKAVANDIEVKLGTARTDTEIAHDVMHAMGCRSPYDCPLKNSDLVN